MCGICGMVRSGAGRPADADLLARMTARIIHRGPDDDGYFVEGPVGLGMRRLSIIDVAGGDQPIFNEDQSVCVIFNGEIYNFQQLREELIEAGHKFRTQSDTEVLVHLYEEDGIDFVKRLNGMFAIALWDRSARRLVLARDRLGKKPLYYCQANGSLIFGSEIKCLLECDEVPQCLNEEAIYHYFTLGYIPHPHSVYKEIVQLPPAGQLVFEGGNLQLRRYWSVPCRIDNGLKLEDTRQQLRELLTDAVRLRMISEVPLGAFLSGGLDSSITVALMAGLSHAPVKTFHIDYAESAYSEREYARAIAQRYHTEHHELVVRPSAIEVLDQLVDHFDEPYGDHSAIPTWYVSQMTRKHVTVALAGDGGDECFGGYSRYPHILARRELAGPLRTALGQVGRTIHRCLPRTAPGRQYFRSLGLDNHRYFAVGASELETREMLSPELIALVGEDATFNVLRPALESADPSDPLSAYTNLDLNRYLPDDILTKVDRMSMAHSLELRSPFLDYRVVELATRLPYRWKISAGQTKRILKDAFADLLPPQVLEQRKRGFSVPIAAWLRTELRSALEDAVADTEVGQSGLFRMSELRLLAREHLSGRRNRADLMWRYLFFVRWWHRHHQHPARGASPSGAEIASLTTEATVD